MTIESSPFGTVAGRPVTLYSLINGHGHVVKVTDYGAILVSVEVPDRAGNLANVNLGYSSLEPYLERHPYLGATVGRFCNRIAGGRFELDGTSYSLVVNNGPNHLHGGTVGFDKMLWEATELPITGGSGLRLTVVSPDGQEGYPGNLSVTAEFHWTDDSELTWLYRATTDAPTVLNMTNHAYWNLAGAGQGTIHGHELKMTPQRYLAVDETLIPTGETANVQGSPLDFLEYRTLGERIDELPATKGYDHCYVLETPSDQPCCFVREPSSGRTLQVRTTQPGVQLYTGNHLGGGFAPYSGFCLETQHYPDSPNQPRFPTTRLDPGQEFHEQTTLRFGVMDA